MKQSNSKRTRRKFTAEFKQNVVDLVTRGEKSAPQVCRDLDLTESVVRRWIRLAEQSGDGSLVSHEAESEELRRLRAENRLLKQEREILVKAAAFFAKEST